MCIRDSLYPPVLRDAGRGGLCAAGGSEVQYKEGVQAQAEGYTEYSFISSWFQVEEEDVETVSFNSPARL